MSLYRESVDMVVSVKECAANPYYCVFEENQEGFLHICKGEGNIFRRQDAPMVYEYNGAIYVMNSKVLKTTHMHEMQKRVKYVMDDLSSFDLDTMWDWKMAEMIKKENSDYREYEDDYLFEFEERMLINMRRVYDRIRNEKDVFTYDDLLPSKIENIIGRKRFFNINNYVVITYYRIIYVGRMEKDDYETAIKDIQKHITQMFVWED